MTIEKIYLNGVETEYVFVRKNVKNVNLRVKGDGTIYVSANRFTSKEFVERFLQSKADVILNFRKKSEEKVKKTETEFFSENELEIFIIDFCKKIYPYYRDKGIKFPLIKFRKMTSMWGNCYPRKGIVTFSKFLIYAKPECVEYVVWHEFTHFLVSGHQKDFYDELSKVCPNWKELRKQLKRNT